MSAFFSIFISLSNPIRRVIKRYACSPNRCRKRCCIVPTQVVALVKVTVSDRLALFKLVAPADS